jgi:hypothetical protein
MFTITNDFHGTSANVKAEIGDEISKSVRNRVRRTLCGIYDCCCGHADGSRNSRYSIEQVCGDGTLRLIDNKVTE